MQKGWVVGYGFFKKGAMLSIHLFSQMAKFNAASCVFLPYLHSKAKGGGGGYIGMAWSSAWVLNCSSFGNEAW